MGVRFHSRRLAALDEVRCLECGRTYPKPSAGGTVRANPGCPRCGYVGWIPATLEFSEESRPTRFVADLPRHRQARLR